MANKLILTALFSLVLALPTGAVEWQHIGLDGVQSWSLTRDWDYLFVTEIYGVHYLDLDTDIWTSHVDSIASLMCTALTRYPPEPTRVVAGGGTAFFNGYLAVSEDMGENFQYVDFTSSGPVTDMATSYSWEVYHLFATSSWGEFAPAQLLRSTDGGLSWHEVYGHMQEDLEVVVAIDTNEVWVAGDRQVTRTLDSGQTWESFQGNLNPDLWTRCFWTEPGVVGIPDQGKSNRDEPQSYAGPLFYSNDEGLFMAYPDTPDWEQILPDPCRAVVGAFRWEGPFTYWYEVVAVTQDGRVLYTRSNYDFLIWQDWTAGIAPAVPIDVTVIDQYYVLTQNSGVFRTALPVSDVPEAEQRLVLEAYPNPFNPRTTFAFTVEQAGWCELAMFDLQGRRIATLREQEVSPGPWRITWQPENLASGVFVARLRVGDETATRRVVLVK